VNRRRVTSLLVVLAAVIIVASVGFYFVLNGTFSNNAQATPTAGRAKASPFTGKVCSGVTKNSDGSYTFAWLHVSSNGYIVDQNNCVVPLDGVNMGGLFLGNAGGKQTLQDITNFKQLVPMDLVRVNFNTQWWNSNVYVPDAHMNYQQWLQQYVKWQEESGNYVELDAGPHFPEPPCGGTITFCPAEDQGQVDYRQHPGSQTALELDSNIQPAVQAWQALTKIYANDPAIIYDVWNEPVLNNLPKFFSDMNTLINTVRAENSRSLVVVFGNGWKKIVAGKYPNYTQPNLVIDAHIYDGFTGTSPADGHSCQEPGKTTWTPEHSKYARDVYFAHQHGEATIINEWGGCYDLSSYNEFLTSFATANDVSLAYFQSGNLVNIKDGQLQLNANGLLVKPVYSAALA
jgi:hypothetical protein